MSPWPLTKRAFVFAALPPPWTGPANSGATASRSGLIAGAGALPHPGTRGVRVARCSAKRTTESSTAVNARSGPQVFDPTALRDARGGRYLKYRPPPVAAPSILFVAWRRPPAPLLAGALRHARELMMVHPRLSHPFVHDPPSPIRRRQQLAWHRPRPRPQDRIVCRTELRRRHLCTLLQSVAVVRFFTKCQAGKSKPTQGELNGSGGGDSDDGGTHISKLAGPRPRGVSPQASTRFRPERSARAPARFLGSSMVGGRSPMSPSDAAPRSRVRLMGTT